MITEGLLPNMPEEIGSNILINVENLKSTHFFKKKTVERKKVKMLKVKCSEEAN